MQLVAYGAQDIYLTGNPQITFFKVVYRRHTNFSMEAISQTLNGTIGSGNTQTCTISRNGDLVGATYLRIRDTTFGANEGEVYDIVDYVEVEIGGQLIDRQHGDWNAIWWELSTPESKVNGLRSMLIQNSGAAAGSSATAGNSIIYPLNFWFCRNPGLALPLIALQYHEVKLKITWGTAATHAAEVFCDYIYLDTDERRRFAQVSHEYLIEQVQRETHAGNAKDFKLNFNHPVKELIWVSAGDSTGFGAGCQFSPLGPSQAGANTSGTAYAPATDDDEVNIKLVLNGHDRMAQREAKYFKTTQLWQHHTRMPAPVRKYAMANISESATVALVPFAIFPKTSRVTSLKLNTKSGVTSDSSGNTSIVYHGPVAAGLVTTGTKIALTANDLEIDDTGRTTVNKVSVSDHTSIVAANSGLALSTQLGNNKQLSILYEYEELPTLIAGDAANTSNIYVYSFALKPEEHQPSGTCNFSRIDTAKLVGDVNFANAAGDTVKVFAVNYNVLRIMSGMGGLAYSN